MKKSRVFTTVVYSDISEAVQNGDIDICERELMWLDMVITVNKKDGYRQQNVRQR